MGVAEPLQLPGPLLNRHRLMVDEYYRMADTGVLAPDARCELIEGEVVDRAPQHIRQASVVAHLMERLFNVVRGRAKLICRMPLRLSAVSEPEPDLVLLRHRADDCTQAHPGADDVLLLIEVAETLVRYDRKVKLLLYARHGVVEVWLFDLPAGRLHIHRRPSDGEYARVLALDDPDRIDGPGVDGATIDVSDLLR